MLYHTFRRIYNISEIHIGTLIYIYIYIYIYSSCPRSLPTSHTNNPNPQTKTSTTTPPTMHSTTAIFTTLALALTATADSRFCFPIPGQPATVPQDVLALDAQIKLDWAADLCAKFTYPVDGLQTEVTPLEDGIEGSDGKLYGLQVSLHEIRSEDQCNVDANSLVGPAACPGGGLLTLSTPFEQWTYITALN
ncbi:hypothetical protein J3F83DRAFT_732023 [Trichoderma novae-zelandiae]